MSVALRLVEPILQVEATKELHDSQAVKMPAEFGENDHMIRGVFEDSRLPPADDQHD